MLTDIKNILLYNSGGGVGDSLSIIPIIQWLKKECKLSKIYYIQNGIEKHFNNSLKDFDNGFVKTMDFLPESYAFASLKRIKNYSHFLLSKKIIESIGINKFDLILDTQTRINNTLILKSIPHNYFVSPCAKFIFSNPKTLIFNSKNICGRIFDYFEKIQNTKLVIPTEMENIPQKYTEESAKLFRKDKKYIGFSITGGNQTRKKEFTMKTIKEVANYYSDKGYVPTFLIEKKYNNKISYIKENIKNAFFPEHLVEAKIKNPFLVMAIAKNLDSAISIDNGIMHMLGLAGTKTAVFFANNSAKFRPMNSNKLKVYSYLKGKNKKIEELTSNDVINFLGDFI